MIIFDNETIEHDVSFPKLMQSVKSEAIYIFATRYKAYMLKPGKINTEIQIGASISVTSLRNFRDYNEPLTMQNKIGV